MSGELLNPKLIMDRRGFIKKSIVAMAGIVTLTALSRSSITSHLRRTNEYKDTGSIFTPRPGSKLNYWRNKINNFRLK